MTAFGGFLVAQEAVRRMLPHRHGAILFTGASASVKGYAQSAPFAMGKFALRGLAQSMARELSPQGIHVAHFVIDGGIRSERRQAPPTGRTAARSGCNRRDLPASSCSNRAVRGRGRWSCGRGPRRSSCGAIPLRPPWSAPLRRPSIHDDGHRPGTAYESFRADAQQGFELGVDARIDLRRVMGQAK